MKVDQEKDLLRDVQVEASPSTKQNKYRPSFELKMEIIEETTYISPAKQSSTNSKSLNQIENKETLSKSPGVKKTADWKNPFKRFAFATNDENLEDDPYEILLNDNASPSVLPKQKRKSYSFGLQNDNADSL